MRNAQFQWPMQNLVDASLDIAAWNWAFRIEHSALTYAGYPHRAFV